MAKRLVRPENQLSSRPVDRAEREQEALGKGFGPFLPVPNKNDFDPLKEVLWTLPMAVAWLLSRDLDDVRTWWAPYRRQLQEKAKTSASILRPDDPIGEVPNELSRATLQNMLRTKDIAGQVRKAWQLLVDRLSDPADGLTAAAIRDAKPVTIPHEDWAYLKLSKEWRHRDEDVLVRSRDLRDIERQRARDRAGIIVVRERPGPGAYSRVRIRREAILRRWPTTTSKPTPLPPRKKALVPKRTAQRRAIEECISEKFNGKDPVDLNSQELATEVCGFVKLKYGASSLFYKRVKSLSDSTIWRWRQKP